MSNWNLPTITSGYLDFVTEMNDKFVDAGTIGYGAPTNLPEHAMRFNRSLNIFEEWVANAWVPKVIGIAGGGTGGTDPAAIRVNLGLGSMAVQNSNAVNITGGSITGVNFDAGSVTQGILALARGGTGASLALGAAGTVMLSNGSAVVFAPGTSITSLNAGALTVGIVPLERLSPAVPLLHLVNQFTAKQRISNLSNQGDIPRITFSNMNSAVDKKVWEINVYGEELNFWVLPDAENAVLAAFTFFRDGTMQAAGLRGTPLNASYIVAGMVAPQFLGSGPANAGTFLRGDNTWQAVSTGGGGVSFPPGMIAMFDVACPVGWTRYAAMDNRFPLGHPQPGIAGGSSSHTHGVGGSTDSAGTHQHYFRRDMSVNFSTGDNIPAPPNFSYDGGGASRAIADWHHHGGTMNFTVDGNTDNNGAHAHNLNLATSSADHVPSFYTLVYCRKD